MAHWEDMFKGGNGVALYEQGWLPDAPPRAVLAVAHGYAEHSARYAHAADFFNRHNVALQAFDLRGHGRSQGRRAYVAAFDDYIADLSLFLVRVQERLPNVPIFLLGHSMGGAIVICYLNGRPISLQGVILSAAALKISDDISPLLVKVSGIIGRIAPRLPTVRLDVSGLSRDPAIVHEYENDPLVYHGGTLARTGAQIVSATRRINAMMPAVMHPLLILHGTADRITDPEGSRRLHDRAASTDKTLKLYDGLYHELLNEPERETVMQDILAWMEARLPS